MNDIKINIIINFVIFEKHIETKQNKIEQNNCLIVIREKTKQMTKKIEKLQQTIQIKKKSKKKIDAIKQKIAKIENVAIVKKKLKFVDWRKKLFVWKQKFRKKTYNLRQFQSKFSLKYRMFYD